MERTLISNLHTHEGKEVRIAGWVASRRNHGKLIFIDVRDRSGVIQSVVLPNHAVAHSTGGMLRSEWVVDLIGKVNRRPERMVNANQPNGDIELEITSIRVLSEAATLPFELGTEVNIDTHLDHQPLTLRTERSRAIFRVQAEILAAYRDFLRREGFVEFQAPKLVGDDAEGGGNVFRVEYFKDRDAYLATSPQLYKQIMVGIFERVFSTGNVFRAEKHSTTRHLNEYTSLDVECGFIEDHRDIMAIETRLLKFIAEHLREQCAREFETLGATLPLIPKMIPSMKLREAQELITERTGEDCTQEPDLDPAHERWLSEYARTELGSDFIFITHYPVEKRPMYTYEDEADPGFTKSFDLLFRGIEVTTGGQRIHDYGKLVAAIERKGLDPTKFDFYLQAFKFGLPPHGGWGMGLERLTEKFLGLENVKEATLFPRDMNRIDTLLSEKDETNERAD